MYASSNQRAISENPSGLLSRNSLDQNAINVNSSLNGGGSHRNNISTPNTAEKKLGGKNSNPNISLSPNKFGPLEQIKEVSYKKPNQILNTNQPYQNLSKSQANNPRPNNFGSTKAITNVTTLNNGASLNQNSNLSQSIVNPSAISTTTGNTTNIITNNNSVNVQNSSLLNPKNFKMDPPQRHNQNEEKKKAYVPPPQNNNYKVKKSFYDNHYIKNLIVLCWWW